jgi:hypothetical protein
LPTEAKYTYNGNTKALSDDQSHTPKTKRIDRQYPDSNKTLPTKAMAASSTPEEANQTQTLTQTLTENT